MEWNEMVRYGMVWHGHGTLRNGSGGGQHGSSHPRRQLWVMRGWMDIYHPPTTGRNTPSTHPRTVYPTLLCVYRVMGDYTLFYGACVVRTLVGKRKEGEEEGEEGEGKGERHHVISCHHFIISHRRHDCGHAIASFPALGGMGREREKENTVMGYEMLLFIQAPRPHYQHGTLIEMEELCDVGISVPLPRLPLPSPPKLGDRRGAARNACQVFVRSFVAAD